MQKSASASGFSSGHRYSGVLGCAQSAVGSDTVEKLPHIMRRVPEFKFGRHPKCMEAGIVIVISVEGNQGKTCETNPVIYGLGGHIK